MYLDVRLYVEVETIIMTGSGGGEEVRVRWEEGVRGHFRMIKGVGDG